MGFIEFEEVKQTETQHYLWVEKYRPNTLENYIGNQQLKDTVKGYIEKHDIPHLLFYGTAGTGKCLDYEESIDIEMEVTNDEYEILKKYEIN